MVKGLPPNLEALIARLRQLPAEWRNHASGDGSALYRSGFEQCADTLDHVLADFTTALDEWQRADPAATKPQVIKCLICRKDSYHPTDIEQRYCAQCRTFHDIEDVGLTFRLG